MRSNRHVRHLLISGSALVLAATLAACGGEPTGPAQTGSSDFPESEFPAATFDGLSGQLVWRDSNGGVNTESRNATIWKDFTARTGVTMQADYQEEDKVFATFESGAPAPWSLVEFSGLAACKRAAASDYLQKIDTSKVPVDKLEPGSSDDHCVEAMRSGAVLTWNTDKWPASGKHPETLADIYNTKDFPGKRCLYKGPQYGGVFESALLADGVSPDDIYPFDVPRALAKLDTIKNDIVWFSSGDQSTQLFENGSCDIGIAWSGRIFNAVTKDGGHLAISWKNAILTTGAYGVPKDAPNANAGQAAIAMWILDKKGQQEYVSRMTYATPITGLTYSPDLQPWVPTGENAKAAIKEDVDYFGKEIASLSDKFTAWVSGR